LFMTVMGMLMPVQKIIPLKIIILIFICDENNVN